MRIAVGSDHGGARLKSLVIEWLREMGHEPVDFGGKAEESSDYPEVAFRVARSVAAKNEELGILICGSGIGVAIAANRVRGIRAAQACNTTLARLARQHNDANILTLGERITGPELAKDIIRTFLETRFEGGRHERRVALLDRNPD